MVGASEAACEQARLIYQESSRLVELLEDLLDESRAQMGKPDLRLCHIKLSELLKEAVAVQRRTSVHKGQMVEISFRCEDQHIDVDPVRFRQVLDNLLSNAGKYGPPNFSDPGRGVGGGWEDRHRDRG